MFNGTKEDFKIFRRQKSTESPDSGLSDTLEAFTALEEKDSPDLSRNISDEITEFTKEDQDFGKAGRDYTKNPTPSIG